MRAAEKEVDMMEKQVMDDAEKEGRPLSPGDIKLPMFKELQVQKRARAEQKYLEEKAALEKNVMELEAQIKQIQKALFEVDGVQAIDTFFRSNSDIMSERTTEELANVIAKLRSPSMVAIADEFILEFQCNISKKTLCDKIEAIAVKEKRVEEGDTYPVWHLRDDFHFMLTKETVSQMEVEKKERLQNFHTTRNRKSSTGGNSDDGEEDPGAVGPDGEFIKFPDYDGEEEPRENKKAFTMFCNATRKEVKNSLSPSERKHKVRFSNGTSVSLVIADNSMKLKQFFSCF